MPNNTEFLSLVQGQQFQKKHKSNSNPNKSKNKGNRQFMNIGASLKYNMFGIDFSYLASLNGRQSPLANTLRFTLRLYLGDKPASKDAN